MSYKRILKMSIALSLMLATLLQLAVLAHATTWTKETPETEINFTRVEETYPSESKPEIQETEPVDEPFEYEGHLNT